MDKVDRYTASKSSVYGHRKGSPIGTTYFVMVMESDFNVLLKKYDALQRRLTEAESFVQKMVDCTKGQDSVATGYLSDILDMIKGNSL